MINEQIAKLYGTLEWHVNNSGLRQFQRALVKAQQSLKPLQDAVGKAEDKLNSVGKAAAQQREKLSGRVRHNLNRESQLETALLNAKRQAWQSELKQSKLVFSGKREASGLATAAIRDQQLLFTQLAKTQRKQALSIEAARARQLRLGEMLRTQQARTALIEQRRLSLMTGVQKAELAINQLRQRGERQAIEFQARRASRAAAERRKEAVGQHRAERHGWAMERHQAWQQRQQERQNNGMGVFGLAGLGGLGPIAGIGAGIYALQAAVTRLSDRIAQSQDKASNSEQWVSVLEQAGGKNPENQKVVRDSFIRIAQQYGTSVDLDAAKDYRGFIMQQTSRGESLDKAIKLYQTQMAAYRGAGMNAQEQQRASLQATQVRTKGQGDTEDFKTFAEAAPLIKPYFSQAWAEATKFKGTVAQREAAFYKQLPDGVFKAEYLNRAFELFVKENADAIERQSRSIQAEQQRTDNARTLQEQRLYADDGINQAVRNRIASERELVAATEELKTAFVGFDTWLNKRVAETYRAWVNVFTGKNDYEGKDRFNTKQSGILLNPRLNPGATREREKRSDMLESPPVNLEAPAQPSIAYGDLGKALLSFADSVSPQGKALLMANQDQAPASILEPLKQTFNNNSVNNIDASVQFGDINVTVPSGISDASQIGNAVASEIENRFGDLYKQHLQDELRRTMVSGAERRK
ncbi:hypothetical protein ACLUTX_28765 [Enterobacterales bacterium AE_CKDN230030158-1A_HGKHYDSX7]